jgi:hypothetical protein
MSDIELIVKIPEEIYKTSQILGVKHEDTIQIPLEVITNGVPLQGYGRFINADIKILACMNCPVKQELGENLKKWADAYSRGVKDGENKRLE